MQVEEMMYDAFPWNVVSPYVRSPAYQGTWCFRIGTHRQWLVAKHGKTMGRFTAFSVAAAEALRENGWNSWDIVGSPKVSVFCCIFCLLDFMSQSFQESLSRSNSIWVWKHFRFVASACAERLPFLTPLAESSTFSRIHDWRVWSVQSTCWVWQVWVLRASDSVKLKSGCWSCHPWYPFEASNMWPCGPCENGTLQILWIRSWL